MCHSNSSSSLSKSTPNSLNGVISATPDPLNIDIRIPPKVFIILYILYYYIIHGDKNIYVNTKYSY
ncbi:hypothetical protein GCM10008903_22350 [Clostridium cadaveris]